MPKISQLPPSDTVSAADLLPVSQSGTTNAVSVGALLAQTQPAIIAPSPSLLGRTSIGPGGPEVVGIGGGLTLTNGTLNAATADLTLLPVRTFLAETDRMLVTNQDGAGQITVDHIRDLFGSGTTVSLNGLTPVTSLAQGDLIAVNQGGKDHTITYGNLLNGQTIDQASPAGPASDDDTIWVGQSSNTMHRQTLSAVWPWLVTKLPLWKRPVVELSGNTTLDGTVHNNAFIVCGNPLTLSAVVTNMGSGFNCDVINASTGTVVLGGTIISSSGTNNLSQNQTASIRCVTYSAGTKVFASIGGASAPLSPPGQISGLTATSITPVSITLSWSVPATGGGAATYTIQSRLAGTATWSSAGQTNGVTTLAINGLQAAANYEFTVIAANSSGPGPISQILSVSTQSAITVPGVPTGITISGITSTGFTCSWIAPVIGGAGLTYSAQYRISGQTNWIMSTSGISVTSANITGLQSSTGYEVQITATNSTGSGSPSSPVTASTLAAGGLVSSIVWNLLPSGSITHGSGSIGLNAHVTPAGGAIQFGFSTSATTPPTSWTAAVHVNSDLWGVYAPTPPTAGSWFAWAEGTDGSSPTVYNTSFTVT